MMSWRPDNSESITPFSFHDFVDAEDGSADGELGGSLGVEGEVAVEDVDVLFR